MSPRHHHHPDGPGGEDRRVVVLMELHATTATICHAVLTREP
ncbi:MAG: hypothetical protein ABEJ92_05760 [Halobacteriales archaeon]